MGGEMKLKLALIRLLWNSVADHADCSCESSDQCPECDAMGALGLGRWLTWKDAERRLGELGRQLKGKRN